MVDNSINAKCSDCGTKLEYVFINGEHIINHCGKCREQLEYKIAELAARISAMVR